VNNERIPYDTFILHGRSFLQITPIKVQFAPLLLYANAVMRVYMKQSIFDSGPKHLIVLAG